MKRRNPHMGCRKIAEQISNAFGLEINKDVVRRILIRHYRPAPGGAGPSWLSVIGQTKDRLCSVDLFRCESILVQSYWVMVVMDVFTRRIVGFGVAAANLDGRDVCRNVQERYHATENAEVSFLGLRSAVSFSAPVGDLRILEVDEIKSIPCIPRSHAFIERLIGTIRREYLDQTCFGTKAILNGSSTATKVTTTYIAATSDWPESLRLSAVALLRILSQTFTHTAGENTATASFRPPPQLDLYFATHRTGGQGSTPAVLHGRFAPYGPARYVSGFCRFARTNERAHELAVYRLRDVFHVLVPR
jgi:hypothetical protein